MPAPSAAIQAVVLADYLAAVEKAHLRGDATEHTYRPFLVTLFNRLAPSP